MSEPVEEAAVAPPGIEEDAPQADSALDNPGEAPRADDPSDAPQFAAVESSYDADDPRLSDPMDDAPAPSADASGDAADVKQEPADAPEEPPSAVMDGGAEIKGIPGVDREAQHAGDAPGDAAAASTGAAEPAAPAADSVSVKAEPVAVKPEPHASAPSPANASPAPTAAAAAALAGAASASPAPAPATQKPAEPSVKDRIEELAKKISRGEKLTRALARVREEQWDTSAWVTVMEEAARMPIRDARELYEVFVSLYPTSGKYWRQYCEHEFEAKEHGRVEKLFHRCLLTVLHVDLWRFYVKYITVVKRGRPGEREAVQEAYEFSLAHIGFDMSSFPIWSDYIRFLRDQRVTGPEEPAKILAVRRAYQRALLSPMVNLDAIWRDYEGFEHSLPNKQLAKSLLEQYREKYAQSRIVLRDRKAHREGIRFDFLARPPCDSGRDQQQAQLWRRLVAWERLNWQKLDAQALARRMAAVYGQALNFLYHYPDVWHEAAAYFAEANAPERAAEFFEKGIKALPHSLLLRFACADFEEGRKNVEGARKVYEALMEDRPGPLVFIQYMRFARRAEGVEGARKVFMRARKSALCSHHVFTAAALQEYVTNKDAKVARNIFELGLKRFIREPAFVSEYLNFLEGTNDEQNARVLFQRALKSAEGGEDRARFSDLWRRFVEFEVAAGSDLATIAATEQKRQQAYPEQDLSGLSVMIQRYRFRGLFPCTPAEAEAIARGASVAREIAAEQLKASRGGAGSTSAAAARRKLARPDLRQMAEFTAAMARIPPPAPSTAPSASGAPGPPALATAGPSRVAPPPITGLTPVQSQAQILAQLGQPPPGLRGAFPIAIPSAAALAGPFAAFANPQLAGPPLGGPPLAGPPFAGPPLGGPPLGGPPQLMPAAAPAPPPAAPPVAASGIPEPLGSFLAALPKPELFLSLPAPDVDSIVNTLLAWVPGGAPAFLHPNPAAASSERRGVKRGSEPDDGDAFVGSGASPPVDIYAARKMFRS